MEMPDAPLPASRVARTFGGLALRSMTVRRLSGACLVGSLGSTLLDDVTRARLSSGVTAMLSGGPTTLFGARTSPMTFGGLDLRSMTATVSGGGFGTTFTLPLTRTTLLSLAETAICASAKEPRARTAASAMRASWFGDITVSPRGRPPSRVGGEGGESKVFGAINGFEW